MLSPERTEARTMLAAKKERVPNKLTISTHKVVAKALPLPVFSINVSMKRSNVGAKVMENARRGILRNENHRHEWAYGYTSRNT